jgi:hypothetical protein
MVEEGVIEPLVRVLSADSSEAREYAAAVVSALARGRGENKKLIYVAGAIPPLVALLTDPSPMTQKHAACALWGLSDGKDGVYDKQIVEHGGVAPLIALLQRDQYETRGFAAACLLCLCHDPDAKEAIISHGTEPLQLLAHGPATWLSKQAATMLNVLGVPLMDEEAIEHIRPPSPPASRDAKSGSTHGAASERMHVGRTGGSARLQQSSRTHRGPLPTPASSRGQPFSTRCANHPHTAPPRPRAAAQVPTPQRSPTLPRGCHADSLWCARARPQDEVPLLQLPGPFHDGLSGPRVKHALAPALSQSQYFQLTNRAASQCQPSRYRPCEVSVYQ